MSDIIVTTQAQLDAALKSAKGGDTIKLAAGTYTSVSLNNTAYSSNVTITSLDANNPATIQKVALNNDSNITFKNLTLARTLAPTDPDYTQLQSVIGSSNIVFDTVTISGGSGDVTKSVGWGLFIRNSSNVTLVNSSIDHVGLGLEVMNSTGITVKDSTFHDIRRDGSNFASVTNVVLDGNLFTDMYPINGEHPDAIQFLTSGTTTASSNITIKNNIVMQGDGSAIQGIFMNDEVGTLPYANVNINNNLIYVNGLYNGISVNGGTNVNVSQNTVVSRTDDNIPAWISLLHVNGATVTGNIGDKLVTDSTDTNVTTANNSWLASDSAMLRKFENLNALGAERLSGLLVSSVLGYQAPIGSAAAAALLAQETGAQRPSVSPHVLLDLEFKSTGLTDGSRFNSSTTAAALNLANVSGSAYHVQTGQGFEVNRSNAVQIYALPAFTLSFSLQRDSMTSTAGQILGIFQSWSVSLTSAGELNFTIKNDAGTTYSITTSGAKLIDTKTHNIGVTFDSASGKAIIYVDGSALGSGTVSGSSRALESWGLYVGNPFGTSFSGKVGSIEIQDQALSAADVKLLGTASAVRTSATSSIVGSLSRMTGTSSSTQSATVAIQAPVLATSAVTASVASVSSVADSSAASAADVVSVSSTSTSSTAGLIGLSALTAAKREYIALFHS